MKKMQIAQTQAFSEAMLAASFAEAAGDISLVYGDAGLGKTVSLKQYAADHKDTIYIELKDCDKSPKAVCEKILSSVGKLQRGTDRALVNAITDYLQATPKLIIIDEAQHLSIRALEDIRAINDVTESGIVLCGNPTVYDRMHGRGQAHFAQLYSRIGIRRHIVEPSLEDVAAIFEQYGLDKECILFLHKLGVMRGGIRNCVKVLNIANRMIEGTKEPLNIDHLQSANRLKSGEQ